MITNNTITARFAADRHTTIAWKRQRSRQARRHHRGRSR